MSDPLLTYKVHSDPDPIQASSSEDGASLASLRIIVSNTTSKAIACESISFSFLVGTNAKDFFSDSTGIGTTVPNGWTITQSGGVFTATPDTRHQKIGAAGLLFEISDIKVNEQIGTTDMTITEVANGKTGEQVVELAKFPPQFEVGDLDADPDIVNQGENTTLSWSGSDGGDYELQYADSDGNIVSITHPKDEPDQPLPGSGSYTVENLEHDPTNFYLIVTVPAPGQDKPLTVKRSFSVQVIIPQVKITSFTALGDLIGKNSYAVYRINDNMSAAANLSWEVVGANNLLLNDDIVTGTGDTVLITEERNFTLHAYGPGGEDFSEITVTPKTRSMQISILSGATVRVTFDALPGTYTLNLNVTEVTGEADFTAQTSTLITTAGGPVTTDVDIPLPVMPPYGQIISVDATIIGFASGPFTGHYGS